MKRRNGQGLVEYLILVCLISVSTIAVVSVVGTNIREQYANISSSLGNGAAVKVSAPDKSSYKARGMDDYMEAARKSKEGSHF